MILNSPYISGSLTVTGAITACGGILISGSIASASYALNTSFLNGSGSGEFVPTGSFNTFSSSILSYTGSVDSRLGSIESTTASLNAASGSAITRLNALEVTSGSNITRISALEVASGSAQSQLTSLQAQTGSYATTGSNIFVGSQTITGSVLQSGSLSVNGCITSTGQIVAQTINVQQVTSSIVYSCGDNIFGTILSNSQTFTGSMFITGSNFRATVGTACFSGTVCAPAFVGGTISGTTATFSGALSLGSNTNYILFGTNPSVNPYIQGGSDDALYLGTGNLPRLTISPTGAATFSSSVTANSLIIKNSGVPAAQLFRDLDVISVGSAGQGIEFGARNGSTLTAGAAIYGGLDNPATTGTLVFQTMCNSSLSTKMTITSCGNISIGVSDPDIFARGDARNVGIGASGASDNLALQLNAGGSGGRGAQIYMGQGGTRHFTISSNVTESTIGTTSNTPLRFVTCDSLERLRIFNTGIACFACQVCAPMASISGCIGIGTAPATYTLKAGGRGYFFATNQDAGWGMLTLDYGNGDNSSIYAIQMAEGGAINAAVGYGSYGSSNCGDLAIWTNNGSGLNERLRIFANGIACFACTVCARGIATVSTSYLRNEASIDGAIDPGYSEFITTGFNVVGQSSLDISNSSITLNKWKAIVRGGFANNNEGGGLTSSGLEIEVDSNSPSIPVGSSSITFSRNSSTGKLQVTNNQASNLRTTFVGTIHLINYPQSVLPSISKIMLGNVGIGTTSPGRILEVYSSNTNQTAQVIVSSGTNTKAYLGTFSNSLYLTAGGTFNGSWSTDGSNAVGAIVIGANNNDSSIAFQTNNTNAAPQNRMFINNAGNVGIGTTSPNNKLEIQKTGAQAAALFINQCSSDEATIRFKSTHNANSDYRVGASILFGSAFEIYSVNCAINRFWISQCGAIMIGTGNDSAVNAFDAVHKMGDVGGGTSYARLMMQERTGCWISFNNGGGDNFGVISLSGSGVNYGSNSDYRLKTNIQSMTSACGLSRIMCLRPVVFDWIQSCYSGEGFIAHELQEYIPNAVSGEKDAVNENGCASYQSVDSKGIIPSLVKAIQEQQCTICSQASTINILKTCLGII
jgi:hypothetical protein